MAKPIKPAMSMPPEGDSWDVYRARNWDVDVQTVGQLLSLLGAGGKTTAQQAQVLQEFMKTSPYQACPEPLRLQILDFLQAAGA